MLALEVEEGSALVIITVGVDAVVDVVISVVDAKVAGASVEEILGVVSIVV